MNHFGNFIIAVASQKGGVGKTTTTANLAQALTLSPAYQSLFCQKQTPEKICIVDFDPLAALTQMSGINLDMIKISIADLIK